MVRKRYQPTPLLVGPSTAAQLLGVSKHTLRRWEKNGTLTPVLTPGGHRRYSYALIQAIARRDYAGLTELFSKMTDEDLLAALRAIQTIYNQRRYNP